MKKLFSGALIILWLTSLMWVSFAASDCKEVKFPNGTACVRIEKVSSTKFKLVVDTSDTNWPIRCNIDLPGYNNNTNAGWFLAWSMWSDCNQTFTYDYNKYSNDEWDLKIYVKSNEEYPKDREDKPNNDSKRTFPQWEYSFSDGEWTNSSRSSSSSSSSYSNWDLDNIYLSTDDSSPSTSQRVDLTVKVRDNDNNTITDYRDSLNFKVYYRSSSSSSWIQTSSSTYFEIDNDFDGGYDFTSSDRGVAILNNFIRFKKNYDYKVRVYDENDSSIYKEITFNVWGSSSSSSYSDGFSSKEIDTVEELYSRRPGMISDLEDMYSSLRNNSTWETKSDVFYDDMKDIIDGQYNRVYQSYDEFQRWFEDRYTYTNRVK